LTHTAWSNGKSQIKAGDRSTRKSTAKKPAMSKSEKISGLGSNRLLMSARAGTQHQPATAIGQPRSRAANATRNAVPLTIAARMTIPGTPASR